MTTEALQRQLLQVATERLERIRSLVQRADAEATREALREAHTLKGEARITGRSDLAELTHRLEHAIESGASGEVRARLAELLHMARGGSEPAGEAGRVDLRHTLLRVELEQVSSLSRACAEVRTAQIEAARLAGSLGELAQRTDDTPEALLGRVRSLANRARELAFTHDQRVEALEHQLRELRTIRVDRIFEPLGRAVEDAARALDKEVELRTEGARVSVDRHVLDLVAEPLLHLVRNAVDHGIEAPEERVRRNKRRRGRVGLAARVDGNRICFTVEDDGNGIDAAALPASGASGLHAIFEPGFTTRADVTEISGRGIGLDVVRRRVEAAGGVVRVQSELGQGTRFEIVVPLSLSSDAVVEIEIGGARYALPAADVVRVHDRAPSLESIGDATVVRAEERSLRYRDLGELIGGREPTTRPTIAVLEVDERAVAVGADRMTHVPGALRHALDPFLQGLAIMRGTVTIRDRLVTLLDSRELVRLALETSSKQHRADVEIAPRPQLRVLVAEDSELTRDVLVSWLGGLGCRVLEAPHGAAALEVLATRSVDVLLTDLDMPVLDGFELIERARAAHPELPIVVLSTRAWGADVERARGLGANEYLSKTELEPHELERVVERLIERAAR